MAVPPGFRDFVLEQLRPLGAVTTRPMFGGLTLFLEGRAFALIDGDRLFLKSDAETRGAFEAAGCGPFLPFGDPARPMAYHEAPAEALEDPEVLEPWARLALAAAARAAARKPARRRR